MPSLEISSIFFGTAIILALAPGPDNIFVLTQSAIFGARAGIATTLGLLAGLCFQTAAVALGIAALIAAAPWAFILLKCLGAGYLCWLAWLSFRASASKTEAASRSFPGYWALFQRGVIMNITNPKVLLFFLAFLPQFCQPDAGSPALQIVWFGFLFIIAAFIIFSGVALLGGRLAAWLNKSSKSQIIIHRLSALVFLGLALFLVLT